MSSNSSPSGSTAQKNWKNKTHVGGRRQTYSGRSTYTLPSTSKKRHPFSEYIGAIHIHSTFSDGSGKVSEILEAADGAKLDFLVLTDHNTLRAKEEGWEGWHGGQLLVVGEEVSNRGGHCLAIGTSRPVDAEQSLGAIIEDIVAQQGLAFLAHPHGVYRPLFRLKDHSWGDWGVSSYTGLELWSYMFDWASGFRYYRGHRHYRDPAAQIKGPFPQTLRTWDHLCRATRVVCIGGVDAHARRLPLLPFVVFPYQDLFRTVRTHVLTREPFDRSFSRDLSILIQALGDGHCFISYDLIQDATGTWFGSTDGCLVMGDETEFKAPVELLAEVPADAEMRILRDGHPVMSHWGKQAEFRADSPGVYRLEACYHGKPWIFTNPIYLRSRV